MRPAAILAVSVLPGVALARHGWSGYDPSTVLTMTGPIETAACRYPHGIITLLRIFGLSLVVGMIGLLDLRCLGLGRTLPMVQ